MSQELHEDFSVTMRSTGYEKDTEAARAGKNAYPMTNLAQYLVKPAKDLAQHVSNPICQHWKYWNDLWDMEMEGTVQDRLTSGQSDEAHTVLEPSILTSQ